MYITNKKTSMTKQELANQHLTKAINLLMEAKLAAIKSHGENTIDSLDENIIKLINSIKSAQQTAIKIKAKVIEINHSLKL